MRCLTPIKTVFSAILSISSFITAHITQNDIGWAVGILAGVYAIVSGHYTIRERRIKIKYFKQKMNNEK
jgi:hypothetical protein